MYSPLRVVLWGVCFCVPTLTDENGASNKHVFAPSGRFVGRIQYAPTLTDENRASNKHVSAPSGRLWGVCNTPLHGDIKKGRSNNEKARYPAKLAGIPDALIFFSFPFLASRQEKERSPRKMTENEQQKSRVRAGRIQLRTRHFSRSVWGDTLSRYRMLAIEIISANTPAAVTSAPAP